MTAAEFLPCVAAGTAAVLTVFLDGRRSILYALAGLYLSVAWQLATSVALPIALAKGVMGAAVVGILFRAFSGSSGEAIQLSGLAPTGRGFRVAATLLVLIPASGLVGLGMLAMLPISVASRLGAVWVMALGALEVGLSADTEKRTVGHLVLLCGFELMYVPLEPSLLVTVLLTAVHLGMALVGAYLVSLSGREKPA